MPHEEQGHPLDVIIIGGGLAGLSAALRLADAREVAILAKGRLTEGSSLYAQGGIAAVLTDHDSRAGHQADTESTGAGLCDRAAVEFTIQGGGRNIHWLIEQGVKFSTRDGGEFHLTREGGHSRRRVIHVDDATGRAIQNCLEERVRRHPRIHVYEDQLAVDFLTTEGAGNPRANRCVGVYALDRRRGIVRTFQAPYLILASGGAAKAYLYTSNPDTSTGDGIAMAWRAGCRVANMEFVQFHPTCLFHPQAKSFLLSEAMRGEGAQLRLPDNRRFMTDHSSAGELAPRDIVARAIDFEMKRGGLDCVYLDISHRSAAFIVEHFPTIHQRCLQYGFDMTQVPLPVVPAAHYTCGGVMTDLRGRTDLPGLYAIGECAHTGLHGANRLASNSLLECLVFAEAAARDILRHDDAPPPAPAALPAWDESRVTDADEQIVVSHNWDELRRCMWDYVGIVRTTKRLERARRRIEMLAEEIHDYYQNFRIHNDLIELRNLVVVAELIVRSAQSRRESRGLHFTRDYPNTAPRPTDTVLNPASA